MSSSLDVLGDDHLAKYLFLRRRRRRAVRAKAKALVVHLKMATDPEAR